MIVHIMISMGTMDRKKKKAVLAANVLMFCFFILFEKSTRITIRLRHIAHSYSFSYIFRIVHLS